MRPKLLLSHPPEILAQYFGEAPLAALREVADVTLNEAGRTMTEPELLAAARGQEIIVLDRTTPGPPALFETSPALAAVCRVAVDIRNIDVAAASAAGVLVTQATPGFVEAVAEWIVGAMIDLARGLTRCSMTYRAGEEPATHTGRQLSTAVVGIVGYGRIARRLHALLTPFGSRILASDPYLMAEPDGPELVGLDDLLARSDFVVCLAVATEETESLFDASRFGRMKRGAFFVNASRGNLVEESALANALATGRLAGAALDVGRAPDQRPSPWLAARPDVIATPHTAGNTPEAVAHQAWDVVRQVSALARGEIPEGAVNADSWMRRSFLAGARLRR
ncbi:MAG TPA: NAD(P)-dependent oxidoreductase [Beijerinckiaceae bacterium]|jgi:D-3-phosphoglycerate dehydrogenase